MANRLAAGSRLIDRRTVLHGAVALAAAGPALMREGHAAARPPVVIDAQVHAYAANTPERPWHSVPNWPAHVTGDEMVAAMDKVGVDGAIYISPFSMYQYDGSFAVSVQRAHPDKFAWSNRSTRMIRRWAMSSPTGRRRRARSASASS